MPNSVKVIMISDIERPARQHELDSKSVCGRIRERGLIIAKDISDASSRSLMWELLEDGRDD
jgi:hypothetical protein